MYDVTGYHSNEQALQIHPLLSSNAYTENKLGDSQVLLLGSDNQAR